VVSESHRVVVVIQDGMVSQVYSNGPAPRLVVIDLDAHRTGPGAVYALRETPIPLAQLPEEWANAEAVALQSGYASREE
jgi:hypothetical protein